MRSHPLLTLFYHCLIPLFIGGSIYLLKRPSTLLMFSLIENTELYDLIFEVRPFVPNLPGWIVYSLPDALWSYSMIFFIRAVWEGKNNLWLIPALLLGIVPEVLQLPGIIPGTFDVTDLLMKAAFIVLAITQQANFKTNIYEKGNS